VTSLCSELKRSGITPYFHPNALEGKMNQVLRFLSVLLLSLGAITGCGGELPSSMTPDASVATADAARADANLPGTDAVVSTTDSPTPAGDSASANVCTPTYSSRCTGATMCRPSQFDACTGAQACSCGTLTPAELTRLLEYSCQTGWNSMTDRPEWDQSCIDAVRTKTSSDMRCSPGSNNCSVHLPDDITYEPSIWGESARTWVMDRRWWIAVPNGSPRSITSLWAGYSAHGHPLARLIGGRPGAMECVNLVCYWHRSSALRNILPSAVLTFTSRCDARFDEYAPGASEPTRSDTLYNDLAGTACVL
jgi:predicted small lipoprotein YifL